MRKFDQPSTNPGSLRWGPGVAAPDHLQEQKRKAIVQSAGALFNERGYQGTSLADVAVLLGVTKQAIYYYFKDKQSLLFACSLQAHLGALALFDGAPPQSGGPALTGRTRLARFLERYAMHVVAGNFQFVMFVHATEFDPEQLRQLLACRTDFDNRIRALIERAIADGSIRPCDAKLASLTLLGAVNWIARWFRHDGALPLESVAAQVVELSLAGFDRREGQGPAGAGDGAVSAGRSA